MEDAPDNGPDSPATAAASGREAAVEPQSIKLNEAFEKAHRVLGALPGVDLTPEQQQQRLAELDAQLRQRRYDGSWARPRSLAFA